MALAFKYTETSPLETEADYPYTASKGVTGTCAYVKSKGVVGALTYANVTVDSST